MKKERLLRLASLLEVDAHNPEGVKFDLATWGETADRNKVLSCGTTACAMGLAAVSRIFEEDGLSYKLLDNCFNDLKIIFSENGTEHTHWNAPSKLFGITRGTAMWLFAKTAYRGETTERQGELNVARRIRQFVAGKLKPNQAYLKRVAEA